MSPHDIVNHSAQEIIDNYHYTEVQDQGDVQGVFDGYYVSTAFRFTHLNSLLI